MRKSERCFVTIANADQWMSITGEEPPMAPITAGEYTKAGLPWFEYYGDDQTAIEGAKLLGNIKSVKNITSTDGENIWPKDQSAFKAKLAWLTKRTISAGKWP